MTGLTLRFPASPTVLMKQIPIAAFVALALILSLSVPALGASSPGLLALAGVLTLAATGLAAVLTTSVPLRRYELSVPAIDIVAIGFLLAAVSDGRSIFRSLVILPIIWFAAEEGRRYVLHALFGTCLALLIPILLGREFFTDPSELLRGLLVTLTYGAMAVTVNELSSRARIRLAAAKKRQVEAAEELSRAAAVQRALLPTDEAPLADYHIAGACAPSRSVGGDFFDWYAVNGGVAVTLGDVMGKGVGAGMIAATARAVLRGAAENADPTFAARRMATCLNDEMRETATFLTLFHARLCESTGVLTYADAGHGLTMVIRSDGTSETLRSTDLPIGILPDDTWSSHEVTLNPGDTLVTFSDGVLDLYDGTMLAVERVASIVSSAATVREAVDMVMDVAHLQQNPDDVTVVALRRDPVAVHVNAVKGPGRQGEELLSVETN